ncbi:MAG TPA: preprotein translocase subunit SecE [Gammaproteobacteria bacterium]|nr:preprotein translocase subunit SecE [Gammaproteobacteria bacterium]HKH21876.1 preprotein translocase subunit SecE [Gammaproteobacteria bacterium]
MASKTETQNSSLDTAKLTLAVLLLIVGVIGFYWYQDESALYRVLSLVAITVIAAGIAISTAKGQSVLSFLQGSRTEVRKMVWPSRAETVQTTLAVVLVVIVVGVFMWLLDMLLGWLIRFII